MRRVTKPSDMFTDSVWQVVLGKYLALDARVKHLDVGSVIKSLSVTGLNNLL